MHDVYFLGHKIKVDNVIIKVSDYVNKHGRRVKEQGGRKEKEERKGEEAYDVKR